MNERHVGWTQVVFAEEQRDRLLGGLKALLVRRRIDAIGSVMRGVGVAFEEAAAAMRDVFIPAFDRFAFALQRSIVEMLNSEPWYRHLRLRWSLRRSRQWSLTYTLTDTDSQSMVAQSGEE